MQVQEILENLKEMYPDARCELSFKNPYEMAVAVILSAQTTDASVNRVTPALFERFPTPESLASADVHEIESYIKTLGLYRNKAKQIQGMAKDLIDRYDGLMPQSLKELTTLPGIGRKCANVIQSECFGIPALAVDTHCNRVAKRLGLAKPDDSLFDVERKLKRKIPRDEWINSHHLMIFFGRYRCKSQHPQCEGCPFFTFCKYQKGKVK